jgi:putative Mg2+ transporter-C (MgtC) family protein
LVSLASATFGLVSLQVVYFQHYAKDGLVDIDVSRIAASIVTGVGFLGGGAILKSGVSIKGLTTAASLWLVAAIGLAAGGGMFLLAGSVTSASLFALVVLRSTVSIRRRKAVRLSVWIDLEGDFLSRAALVEFLKPAGGDVAGVEYTRNFATNRSHMNIHVKLPDAHFEEPLMKRLEALPGLRRIKVSRLK